MQSLALTLTLALLLLAAITTAVALLRRGRVRDERYRGMLEQLPNTSIATFDHGLRCTEVLGASGVDPSVLIGRLPEEIYPGADGNRLAAYCQAALAGRERKSFEFHSPLSDHDYWMHIVPLLERGEVVGGMALSQDVTDLRFAERSRNVEAERRQLVLEEMNEAYVRTDAAGVVTDWNRAAELTFGYSAGEAIGRPLAELIIPESDHADLRALLERRLPGQPASGRYDLRAERRALHRDGHEFTVELAATLIEAEGVTTLQALMHDISERKLADSELRQHARDLEALTDAVGELARSTLAQEARMAICRAATRIADADFAVLFEPDPTRTGLMATATVGTELVGTHLPFTERSGAVATFASLEKLFVSDIHDDPVVEQSIFHRTEAISALWLPVQREVDEPARGVIAVAWRDRVERLSERLGQIMDVVSAEAAVAIERAALLDRLDRMTRTDDLTGLANRRAWDHELARELLRADRDENPLAIAMMDLDRFKDYNDRLGHQAGDRFLKEAAGAWRAVLRETDLLARYGGEEFAVALPGCDAETAFQLVERLRAITPGHESCSAGVAIWNGVESADELLGRADAALYEAKQGGRDRIELA